MASLGYCNRGLWNISSLFLCVMGMRVFFSLAERRKIQSTRTSHTLSCVLRTQCNAFFRLDFSTYCVCGFAKRSPPLCAYLIYFSLSLRCFMSINIFQVFFCLRYDSFIVWCSTRNIHSCAIINQRQDRKQSNEWRKERNLNKICMEWAIWSTFSLLIFFLFVCLFAVNIWELHLIASMCATKMVDRQNCEYGHLWTFAKSPDTIHGRARILHASDKIFNGLLSEHSVILFLCCQAWDKSSHCKERMELRKR